MNRFIFTLWSLVILIFSCAERDFQHPFGYDSVEAIFSLTLTSDRDTVFVSWNNLERFGVDSVEIIRFQLTGAKREERYLLPVDSGRFVSYPVLLDTLYLFQLRGKRDAEYTTYTVEDSIIPGPNLFWLYDYQMARIMLLSYDLKHIWRSFSTYSIYPGKLQKLAQGGLFVLDYWSGRFIIFKKHGIERIVYPGMYLINDATYDENRDLFVFSVRHKGLFYCKGNNSVGIIDTSNKEISGVEFSRDGNLFVQNSSGEIYLYQQVSDGWRRKLILTAREKGRFFSLRERDGIVYYSPGDGFNLFESENVVFHHEGLEEVLEVCWISELQQFLLLTYDNLGNSGIYLLSQEGNLNLVNRFEGYAGALVYNYFNDKIYCALTDNSAIVEITLNGKVVRWIKSSLILRPLFLNIEP